jgi:KDO2-lipid IV(A) lauroyltransferase
MSILEALKNKQWRKQTIRYWLIDPFWGGLDYLCHTLFRWLPLSVPAKIGAFLGPLAVAWRFKMADQRAENNLKNLKPELSDQQRKALLHQMWQNIGQTMSEYSIADLLWQDGRVEVRNSHYVAECRAKGQPIIFVTIHLANWEVIGGYCKENGISSLSLYQPQKNRFVTQIAEISRKRIGLKTVAAGSNALRVMCKHIANGGALWFAIDEYKNQQVWWPQLGRNIPIAETNAAYVVRLAERFNAAIIPYRTERKPDSHFIVTASEPLIVNNNSDEVLLKLDQLMESWILERPEDWYMLHLLR